MHLVIYLMIYNIFILVVPFEMAMFRYAPKTGANLCVSSFPGTSRQLCTCAASANCKTEVAPALPGIVGKKGEEVRNGHEDECLIRL